MITGVVLAAAVSVSVMWLLLINMVIQRLQWGAMMMTKSEASVFCILSSIVSMNPEAVDIVNGLLSDIGKVYTSYLFFCRHIAISQFFLLLFMVIGIREEPSYGTLINLEWLGDCTFHIIVIYLSNNMGHLP